jgi:hypothetical protein
LAGFLPHLSIALSIRKPQNTAFPHKNYGIHRIDFLTVDEKMIGRHLDKREAEALIEGFPIKNQNLNSN